LRKIIRLGGALAILTGCVLVEGVREVRAQWDLLPSGWVSQDIGSPAAGGSASESDGTWTITGSGTNIWGTADQFHFAHRLVNGDVDISACITDLETPDSNAKAGVMIRDALTGNSRNAFSLMSPALGMAFQRRTAPGGRTVRRIGGSGQTPLWVRLVREGNLFTSYLSDDGDSWTNVGSATINMPATAYVGLAVTSRAAGQTASATFTHLRVATATSLPSPWLNRDVGTPALAGAATESDGTFSVTGAGLDIWGASDQFHFVYQPAQGDVEIVARVGSLQESHPWSKAGVMIRASLTGDSPHAFMLASAANGWGFQRRRETSGRSYHTAGPAGPEGVTPGWVRLVREGDLFSAYYSDDGTNWSLVASDTIALPSAVYVGLAVTSHNAAATTTATFDNVTVQAPAPGDPPPPGNKPPTVTLTSPSSGATFTAPATITMNAAASDADGAVTRVDFYAGSQLVGSDSTSPFTATWTNAPAGSYELTAVATDSDAETTTSAAVDVTVNEAGNQPPSVSITSPAQGASFTAPVNITIRASASDSDGTVTRVEFYRGSTLIGSDTTSPYAVTWNGATAGSYTLTAKAIDNGGVSGTSAAVSITVNSPQNQLPSVSITSPTSGAEFIAPASVAIRATASDPDGTITRVDFYVGSQLIATDTTSPYSAAWTNVGAGNYTLTAVAQDNAGGTGTSDMVVVTVSETAPVATTVVFEPSVDHAENVTSYIVALYRASDPATASPVATRDLGMPAVVGGEIAVDISTLVNPLPAGSYYAIVRASGPGGTTPSEPSAPFVR